MESLKKLILNFYQHCRFEKKLSSKTLKAYSTDLRQFLEVIPKECDEITKVNKDILKYFIEILHSKFEARSTKRKLACVKAFFNYVEYDDEKFINPFRKLRIKIKEPFRLPSVMNFTEINELFSKLYKLKSQSEKVSKYNYQALIRDIAVLELFFATGLRVSELSNILIKNINLEDGYVKVIGKGNKERILQVCNLEVLKILKEYKEMSFKFFKNREYFFINRLGKRLSEQSIRNMVKSRTKLINSPKRITPHTYRHTFATMLLDEGVDIKYIQKLLGHSSIMTTQIYTHVSSEKQREILSFKHPRNKLKLAI